MWRFPQKFVGLKKKQQQKKVLLNPLHHHRAYMARLRLYNSIVYVTEIILTGSVIQYNFCLYQAHFVMEIGLTVLNACSISYVLTLNMQQRKFTVLCYLNHKDSCCVRSLFIVPTCYHCTESR